MASNEGNVKAKTANKKTATKTCNDCNKQVPVACKSCTCGNNFRKPPIPEAMPTTTVQRRTTQRVRRGRPNFFNAMEFVTPTTGRRRRTTSSSKSSDTDDFSGKKKRGRPRQLSNRNKDEEANKEEEDMFANIPPEKALQYHLILADLNRKLVGQNFKPS